MDHPRRASLARAMAAQLIFFEPAVQNIGIHAVLQSQSSNGGTRAQASCHEVNFELGAVGAVRAPQRLKRSERVFEHRVHASYVHTIVPTLLCFGEMGSPDAYHPTAAIGNDHG